MKSDDYILSYVNHFKSIIDNDLEREVFSYLAEREEQNLDGHIKEIHKYLCKKYKNLSKNDIEEAMKNLLLKGFISLYIWNTQLWYKNTKDWTLAKFQFSKIYTLDIS